MQLGQRVYKNQSTKAMAAIATIATASIGPSGHLVVSAKAASQLAPSYPIRLPATMQHQQQGSKIMLPVSVVV